MSGSTTDTGAERRRRFMRRALAAEYVNNTCGFSCSQQWPAKLAVTGAGPKFRKSGRTPIYEVADLDAWALDRLGIERCEA